MQSDSPRAPVEPDHRQRQSPVTAIRSSWRSLALLAIVVVAIWLPRVSALDRVVTPDEHIWLARSANFYYALAHGDFAGTYQFAHPGVTVMWAGAATYLLRYPGYADDTPGQVRQWYGSELATILRAHGHEPLDMLVASRTVLLILHTLILGLAFLQASRLLGRAAATLGFLIIAWSPFHISLSQILHLDAMTSNLMLLSTLALLNFRYRGHQRRTLLLAGVTAGLAWLTRSPAVILVGVAGLVALSNLVAAWRERRRSPRQVGAIIAPYVAWGVVGVVIFVALWPAMWVDPLGSLRQMVRVTSEMAVDGHELPLFFDGAIYEGDPGALFYPISYLWRTTPVTLVGLAAAVIGIALPRTRLIPREWREPLTGLIVVAMVYLVAMSFGAKKFDRYLLPSYLPLDLAAGAGWVAIAAGFRSPVTRGADQAWTRFRRVAAPAVLALAIGGQAVSTGFAYPYYYGSYNSLMGGTSAATEVMMVGWGEGLDQVAAYLNAQPDAADLQVLTRAWPTSLAYFFDGATLFTNLEPTMLSIRQWVTSDYYLLYITETQRHLVPPEMEAYFASRTPVSTVEVNGVPYAELYDIRSAPFPAYYLPAHPCATDFGSTIRFLAYTWPGESQLVAGSTSSAFFFQNLTPVSADLLLRLRVVDGGGIVLARDKIIVSPPAADGQGWSVESELPRLTGAVPPGSRIELAVANAATDTGYQARDTSTGNPRGSRATLACD